MLQILNDFLGLKINAKQFMTELESSNLKTVDEKEIIDILESNENYDQSTIIYLILYYINKNKFKNCENDFIDFLKSLEYETSSDLNKQVLFALVEDNFLMFTIDNVYFIVNNNNKPFKVLLPIELQNDNHFCLNCNHDLFFKEYLELDSYEFYIIEK